MSRAEWLTIVLLLGAQCLTQIVILVYLRFLWDVNEKLWREYWNLRRGD